MRTTPRVLALQRWADDGYDVVVLVHLGDTNRFGYRIGLPTGGWWSEVFNSDVYEGWVNRGVVGNGFGVQADNQPLHGLDDSAPLTLPANSIVVLQR